MPVRGPLEGGARTGWRQPSRIGTGVKGEAAKPCEAPLTPAPMRDTSSLTGRAGQCCGAGPGAKARGRLVGRWEVRRRCADLLPTRWPQCRMPRALCRSAPGVTCWDGRKQGRSAGAPGPDISLNLARLAQRPRCAKRKFGEILGPECPRARPVPCAFFGPFVACRSPPGDVKRAGRRGRRARPRSGRSVPPYPAVLPVSPGGRPLRLRLRGIANSGMFRCIKVHFCARGCSFSPDVKLAAALPIWGSAPVPGLPKAKFLAFRYALA